MMAKDPYITKIEAKIEELDAELRKMKAQAKGKGADAEIQFDEIASEYEKKKAALEKNLKDVSASGGGAAKDIQEGAERAFEELNAAFAKAKSRFS
ncbi:MAG TPA: hypothetical protein ENO06_00140 [Methanolinea sp.]|nr:hypothetical protein [Methanolinea sp.]